MHILQTLFKHETDNYTLIHQPCEVAQDLVLDFGSAEMTPIEHH